MTPSTAAPTAAGALDMRAALTQIDTIAVCVGAVDPRNFRTMLATIAGIARAALRNSAPQETRGDEPTDEWCNAFLKSMGQWVDPHEPEKECGVAIECGITQEDADSINAEFRAAVREALTDAGSLAASQQSPRMEREAIAKAIHARRYHLDLKDTASMFAWYAENPQGTDRSRLAIYSAFQDADAILALLSPDMTVVPSTEREPGPMVPWELNCQRAVCAAPECECPAPLICAERIDE